MPDDQNLQLFIDGKSYRPASRVQACTQFILVLANAAIRRPPFILIDERTNLHPSLQLDFLTTLASYAKEGVLFATHSYGLARSSSDRLYSLTKTSDEESQVAPFESLADRLPEFLGELRYAAYASSGFNRILLVEGPTEAHFSNGSVS